MIPPFFDMDAELRSFNESLLYLRNIQLNLQSDIQKTFYDGFRNFSRRRFLISSDSCDSESAALSIPEELSRLALALSLK